MCHQSGISEKNDFVNQQFCVCLLDLLLLLRKFFCAIENYFVMQIIIRLNYSKYHYANIYVNILHIFRHKAQFLCDTLTIFQHKYTFFKSQNHVSDVYKTKEDDYVRHISN